MNLHVLTPWQWKNLRTKAINEKSTDQTYSYGCIMGFFGTKELSEINADQGLDQINPEDIYNNEDNEYGLEIEPHVTILYGLHDTEIDEEEVIQLLKSLKLPTVKLTEISCFKNDDYDVLKWDVESEFLNLYNKIVTLMFPYTNKFPEYHAHCTIAYLKPGTGEKYCQSAITDIEVPIITWVYSQANGKKVRINAQGSVEVMRVHDDQPQEVQENKQNNSDDESYEYKGYLIELHKNQRFENAYNCRVLKNGEYKMGLKGPVSLELAKKDAEFFVDGSIAKNK